MRLLLASAFALQFLSVAAFAQLPLASDSAATINQSSAAPAQATCCIVPALTDVTITINKTINSQANHAGETFPITLAVPIVIDGTTLVPAGTSGAGEIVHAAKSRFGGRAGELILAVRYFQHGDIRIPLRSLRYIEGRGKDRGDTAAAISIASSAIAPIGGVISMFITGGEVNILSGTPAKAKTAAAVTVPNAAEHPSAINSTPEKGSNP
jgi:hypothetical protein